MEKKALMFAKRHNMLEKGDGIIAGISGGADSMCLLSFLLSIREETGLSITAVHINHGIRGDAADGDEAFVRGFCETHGVDFIAVHADVPALARESGCTEEETGRNLRYEEFVKACRLKGYRKIAVAHNSDDNVETVLFNIFRGSGILGLSGISPVTVRDGDIKIIRPLLETSRSEIEEYLSKKGVSYRTDATNLEDAYCRNRIRNRLIPYIKEAVNEGAVRHISELSSQAAELESFAEGLTGEAMKELENSGRLNYVSDREIRIDCDELAKAESVIRKRIIRCLIGKAAGKLKDIEAVHIEAVAGLLEKGTGKSVSLPYGLTVRRDYGQLVFETVQTDTLGDTVYIECELPGEYRLDTLGAVLRLSLCEYKKNDIIPKKPYTKWFDYDKIRNNLVIRSRRQGDYIQISRGTGACPGLSRKTLKSYFIDTKTDRTKRESIPLLAEGSSVLWVIGERGSDAYHVTDSTVRVLSAELLFDLPAHE